MPERFEAEIHLAIRFAIEFGGLALWLGLPIVLWLRGWDIVWLPVLVGPGLASWLVVRSVVLGQRYDLSADGLAIQQGPFRSRFRWDSITRVSTAQNPNTGKPNFVLSRVAADDLPVRPKDHSGFLAALRRHGPQIEVTAEAERLARGNGAPS